MRHESMAVKPFKMRRWLGLLAVSIMAIGFPLKSSADQTELYILWGLYGKWDGQLEISHGKLNRVLTYSFEEEYSDRLLQADETRASWLSGVAGQFDGLHLFAETGPATHIRIRTPYGERELAISDFPADKDAEISFHPGKQFLIIGRGDPAAGPKNALPAFPLPLIYQSPKPVESVRLPDRWWRNPQPLRIDLSEMTSASPTVRRVSNNDGRLYLEIAVGTGFKGTAAFKYGPGELGMRRGPGPFWLAMEPRVARLAIEVTTPKTEGKPAVCRISAPTTLVETRKTRLYVNGEPFLVKGTLPRDLNDADAAYLKSLGANCSTPQSPQPTGDRTSRPWPRCGVPTGWCPWCSGSRTELRTSPSSTVLGRRRDGITMESPSTCRCQERCVSWTS